MSIITSIRWAQKVVAQPQVPDPVIFYRVASTLATFDGDAGLVDLFQLEIYYANK